MDNIRKSLNKIKNEDNKEHFRNKYSLEARKKESKKIMEKYPDRIPIIVEKDINSDIKEIDKKKYLVPNDLTVGQFLYVIRKRIKLGPEKALYIFIEGIIPPTNYQISTLYDKYKGIDGFMIFTYSAENTFGN